MIIKQIHRFFQDSPPTKKQLHDIKMASIRMDEIPARGVHINYHKGFGNVWAVLANYPKTKHNVRYYGE